MERKQMAESRKVIRKEGTDGRKEGRNVKQWKIGRQKGSQEGKNAVTIITYMEVIMSQSVKRMGSIDSSECIAPSCTRGQKVNSNWLSILMFHPPENVSFTSTKNPLDGIRLAAEKRATWRNFIFI